MKGPDNEENSSLCLGSKILYCLNWETCRTSKENKRIIIHVWRLGVVSVWAWVKPWPELRWEVERRWNSEACKQQKHSGFDGGWDVGSDAEKIVITPGFCSGCWIWGSTWKQSGGGEGNGEFRLGAFQAGRTDGSGGQVWVHSSESQLAWCLE